MQIAYLILKVMDKVEISEEHNFPFSNVRSSSIDLLTLPSTRFITQTSRFGVDVEEIEEIFLIELLAKRITFLSLKLIKDQINNFKEKLLKLTQLLSVN